jgi:protein tyrosine phosphatase (PTP) superfamily phosphohydrolase (DUF442 family)
MIAPPSPVPGHASPGFPQPGTLNPPPPSFPQLPPSPGEIRHFPPQVQQQVDFRWRPAEGSVQLSPPQPLGSESPRSRPQLYPPEISDRSSGLDRTNAPPALPVGIPDFNVVKDKVTAGRRPSLDDGLDWLKDNGYKAVLYIRLPNDADSADRKQVEQRGMKYLSLEVSPQAVTSATVDEFNRFISDKDNQPLFVYDREGYLAGGLWYLHFRIAEQASDEAARIRAASLGLREDRDDNHRAMWLAIQAFLSRQKQ